MKKLLFFILTPFVVIAQGTQPYNTQTAINNGLWDNCLTWNNPIRIYSQTKKVISNGVTVNLNTAQVGSNEIKFEGNGKINLGLGRITFNEFTDPINCNSTDTNNIIDNVIINFNQALTNVKSQTGFLQGLGGNKYWGQDSLNVLPLRSSISQLKPKMFRQNHRDYYQESYNLTRPTPTTHGRVHLIVSGEWISEKEKIHPHSTIHNYINPNYSLNVNKWDEYNAYLDQYFNWGYNNGNIKPGIVWECWNEPDNNNPDATAPLEPNYIAYNPSTDNDYWPILARQNFYEIYKRFYQRIRGSQSNLPNTALVAGPSIGYFKKEYMQEFFDYCLANQLEVNVVTWHEINWPEKTRPYTKLNENVEWVKTNFKNNLKYAALNIKSIEINETIPLSEKNNPAAILASIGNLEKAGVDYACKSCWGTKANGTNVDARGSCLDNSLNDLFTVSYVQNPDGTFPQSVPITDGLPQLIDDAQNPNKPKSAWWVYKLYGDGVEKRVNSYNEEGRSIILASKPSSPTITYAQVLFGYVKSLRDDSSAHYLPDSGTYKIRLNNLNSFSTSNYFKITINKIPYHDQINTTNGEIITEDNIELIAPEFVTEYIYMKDSGGGISYEFSNAEKENLYQMKITASNKIAFLNQNNQRQSIDTIISDDITINPNPSNGIFTINFTKPTNLFGKIIVYNMIGQKIVDNEISINTNQETLDISNFPNGTYLINIFNGEKVILKKIIKK